MSFRRAKGGQRLGYRRSHRLHCGRTLPHTTSCGEELAASTVFHPLRQAASKRALASPREFAASTTRVGFLAAPSATACPDLLVQSETLPEHRRSPHAYRSFL